MKFSNAKVVITGGSQGIGEAIAVAAAQRGADVVLVARSEAKLKAVADKIGGDYLVADLTNADDVDSLVDRAIEKLGRIDIWINNAGTETVEMFANTGYDQVRTLARLNFEAPLLLTHKVLPHMLERGSGHIAHTSSVAGTIPFPGLTAYCGSKAGLINFNETLRLELEGSGVNLTVMTPGPVDTPMWDRLEASDDKYLVRSLRRFRLLGFLPKLSPAKYGEVVAKAIESDKAYVRNPHRYSLYHMLNNAPRRLVRLALIGIKPR